MVRHDAAATEWKDARLGYVFARDLIGKVVPLFAAVIARASGVVLLIRHAPKTVPALVRRIRAQRRARRGFQNSIGTIAGKELHGEKRVSRGRVIEVVRGDLLAGCAT